MHPRKKAIIGITGGMCSGKTAVAKEFERLGCNVIDADEIAHKYLDKTSVKSKIIAGFGKEIINPDSSINRKKLAEIAFSTKEKIALLNDIIHPMVMKEVEQRIEQYKNDQNTKAIILDMPLLLEVGWENRCDKLIFVDSNENIRVQRAKTLDICNKKQFKLREKFQISLDNKKNIADNVINNSSDISELRRQVFNIFSSIVDNG